MSCSLHYSFPTVLLGLLICFHFSTFLPMSGYLLMSFIFRNKAQKVCLCLGETYQLMLFLVVDGAENWQFRWQSPQRPRSFPQRGILQSSCRWVSAHLPTGCAQVEGKSLLSRLGMQTISLFSESTLFSFSSFIFSPWLDHGRKCTNCFDSC